MFVNRKQGYRKGPTDRQIYVPYDCRLKDPGFPRIRSQAMAEFYYKELDHLGYLHDTPQTTIRESPSQENPNNAMLVTITSSDGGYLEFDPDSDSLGPHDIDPESIHPMFDTSKSYAVYFDSAAYINMKTKDNEDHTYWATRFYMNNQGIVSGFASDETPTTNVPLTHIQGMVFEVFNNTRYVFLIGPPDETDPNAYDKMFAFKVDEWVIDCSPEQTLFSLWLYDITPTQ